MPCYHPLDAWRGPVAASGKRSIVFKAKDAEPSLSIFKLKLPCGQCIGCRLERSRQWAMRCMHEASLYEDNCFITLTFDREHLPVDGSLSVKVFQDFMKRLRKRFGSGIRFFHCGEYGENFSRPHYHACLFNFDFVDKYVWTTRNEFVFYRSPALEELWGKGFCLISDVTFESAAYVARYITKKVTGDAADAHYVDKSNGVLRVPEYVTMSRRPGIGKKWFDKFKGDLYPHDYAVVRGKKVRPPKYYDSLYEVDDPVGFNAMKSARVARSTVLLPAFNDVLQKVVLVDESSDARLAVKEEVTKLRLQECRRTLEEV